MKNATVISLALGLALTGAAQGDYVEDWNPDADGDGNVGVTDLLALLSVFSENDGEPMPHKFLLTNESKEAAVD